MTGTSCKNKIWSLLNIGSMVLLAFATIGPMATASDYSGNTSLAAVDGSFIGEAATGYMGGSVAFNGDVNGDGYDDLLLGAGGMDDNGIDSGKVYMFFGKASGWTMDVNVSTADASFIGEAALDISGYFNIIGDVNGDGYDDIAITSFGNDDGGANVGKVYILFGKASGWIKGQSLASADASIIGDPVNAIDSAVPTGDINNDGLADFAVNLPSNADGGTDAGKVSIFFGRSDNWTKNMAIGSADVTYIGQPNGHLYVSSGGGDLNGDGIDDLLVSAPNDDEVGMNAGKIYLIFGKETGWPNTANIMSADASFRGEATGDNAGSRARSGGDLNGDGIDDFLVHASTNDEGASNAGQIYVIFGHKTGWAHNISLSGVNASYHGENINDYLSIAFIAGDVNDDGFDDFVAISSMNDMAASNAGKIYLFYGHKDGWAMDASASGANATFTGEALDDSAGGGSPRAKGDINGDGIPDAVIGATNNDEGGDNAGQAYLMLFGNAHSPQMIATVKAYADLALMKEVAFARPDATLYVDLHGTDADPTTTDIAVAHLTSSSNPAGINLPLREIGGGATGIYRGQFTLSDRNIEKNAVLKAINGDTVKIASLIDPTVNTTLQVGNLAMTTVNVNITVEDMPYSVVYQAANLTSGTWSLETSASWLLWNSSMPGLEGVPDNSHVGQFWVNVSVTDGTWGDSVHTNFTLDVKNTAPGIETKDVVNATEDEPYVVDYNSTDDGQGTIKWALETDADDWLKINATTGNLTGTPINEDVGSYYVNVTVDDGNGGTNFTNFTLTVADVNDGPGITTIPMGTATEEVIYSVDYNATDVDAGDVLTWTLKTDAGAWLNINATSGVLSGTPANDDVGSYYVNVTVKDVALAMDYTNFTLIVENTQDAPVWVDVPTDAAMGSLDTYTFDVNATDVDATDTLTFGMTSTPALTTVALINSTTGVIVITEPPAGVYVINISTTDAQATIYTTFELNVTFENSGPLSYLAEPVAGEIVTTAKPTLKWTVFDRDGDSVLVDVYMSNVLADIEGTVVTASVLTSSNSAAYTPTSYLTPGAKYYWTVIPKDGTDIGTCANGTFNFTVSSTASVNHPPTITLPAKVKDATVGKTYELTVTGTDQDAGTTLTYSLSGAPTGMSIDPNTGEITWKPTKSQTGSMTFSVVASDGEFTASQLVTVKVNKAPEAGLGTDMMMVIVIVIILVLVVLAVAFMRSRKTGSEDSALDDEEEGKEVDEEE